MNFKLIEVTDKYYLIVFFPILLRHWTLTNRWRVSFGLIKNPWGPFYNDYIGTIRNNAKCVPLEFPLECE